MKDKLVKNGKRKPYYRFIAAVKGLGFSLLAVLVLASPVLIALDVATHEARAEETTHVESSQSIEEDTLSR